MTIRKQWLELFFSGIAIGFVLLTHYVVEDVVLATISSCIAMATLTSIMMSRPVSQNGYGRG